MIRLLEVPPVIKDKKDLQMIEHVIALADATTPDDAIVDLRCAVLHFKESLAQKERTHYHERDS